MNRRMVVYMVGTVVKIEALLLLLPTVVALIYKEACAASIAISAAICLIGGFALTAVSRCRTRVIYAREGFVTVALAWIALSAFGALPFFISGEIPSYIDAFFETVSGFTTTSASVLADVETVSRGLLFWRSLTNWIGGMGVLVFIMAIVPSVSDRNMHILRAEVPGPIVGKLVPKISQSTRILYIIYVCLTLAEIVFLLIGGMSLFESVVHAFSTAGTGGFNIKNDSVASYSPYIQWVITVFMLLFGINFNLYYLLLIRRFRSAFKSSELWLYLGVVAFSAATITADIFPLYGSVQDSIRQAVFQVSAVITSTGYTTANFDAWPGYSKAILLLLMFSGPCAGSTGGGLKISRILILVKNVKRELKRLLHPRSVSTVRLDGKTLEEKTISSANSYFAIYAFFLCFIFFLLSAAESFDMETTFSVAISSFNNTGVTFGGAGPNLNYADFTYFSKIVLCASMLFGRLEIYPLFIALSPSTWVKK